MSLAEFSEKTHQETAISPESEETDAGKPSDPRQRPPIGELLRTLRGDRTLRDLERETGIPNAYLSNLELGIKNPGLKTLTKLSAYHEVPLNELLRVAGLRHEETGADREISAIDIKRGFNFLTSDPDLYRFQIPAEPLSLDTQRYIVQLYQHYTGKQLL